MVEVPDDVEEAAGGRTFGQLEALDEDPLEAILGQVLAHLRMVEGEALADDVDGADHVVEGIARQHLGGLVERLLDVVGLDADQDAQVRDVLRARACTRET